MMELANGFILFSFSNNQEFRKFFDNQPWSFTGYPLLMIPWQPDILVSELKLSLLPVWAQVHALPPEYLTLEVITILAGNIGSTDTIETPAKGFDKGRFLRLRITIDIRYPLRPIVMLTLLSGESKPFPVTFEKLPMVCYLCGCLGHNEKNCRNAEDNISAIYGPWLRAESFHLLSWPIPVPPPFLANPRYPHHPEPKHRHPWICTMEAVVQEKADAAITTTTFSPPEGNTTFLEGTTWCVALPGASQVDLQNALDWACGLGMADCSPIQSDGPCFEPDTLLSHASYAFNNYYQQNGNSDIACNFGGTSTPTKINPSYANCIYAASGNVASSAPPFSDSKPCFIWWEVIGIMLLLYLRS
ncbi:hypothetical protein HHK36_004869 [Tetracentron sinense]|uniref:CCHC-type domain-containing protein n=1 Tax=Tetracentron sinense TaxID=13715 RepID=A0A834ZJX2_TETSI|nr:hypothetical protein HHK36_004869 [Tetracentron sinense]